MRRVRDLAKPATAGEQGELFPAWRYHPFFTNSPFETLQAERHHRHHAVIEQVIADGKAGPLAHLPSGDFNANAAWLILWAMSFNLLRAAGRAHLGLPRPRDHRHHPRPPGQRPGPAGALGPPPDPVPAPQLALGRRLAAVVRHPPHPSRQPLTCRHPPPERGPTGTQHVEKLGRPADHPCPQAADNSTVLPKRPRDRPRFTIGGSRLQACWRPCAVRGMVGTAPAMPDVTFSDSAWRRHHKRTRPVMNCGTRSPPSWCSAW